MNNNYLDLGNLQLLSDQLLCSKMALRNGLFPVWGLPVGENGVLSFATGKTYLKNYKTSLILNATLLAYFPFEISFYGNLRAPKRQQRTISPENTKTCWTDKIKDGEDAVYIKDRFIGQFLLK